MTSLLIHRDGPVVRVSLNRPEVRNAFNEDVVAELTAWATGVATTDARVAILSGAGKAFCAGADLMWMSKMVTYSREENERDAMAMSTMFNTLDTLPIPLIGRIHGAALGGGTGLAAVCDIVVAAEDAVFGFTETKLGILPAVISPFAVRKIGISAARELFLTASRFSSARARELGLVHAVTSEAGLDAAVDGYVSELLTSAPEAIAGAKRMIAAVAGRTPSEVARVTAETIARHRVSAEGQAGMASFLEKRPAPWVP
ncbi:MAG: enoyl-CoA hydratase/isomerase family protein [Acidobacteria bacterium]|nr:enoyl-CoA hydratase/isomerase family protein [Acidobacteriota bacterium]